MRKIKFRAWNGLDMLDRELCDRNWYIENKCCQGAMPNDARTLKIMQCTGLKDKKGVEIFEGDLMQNESGRICQVVWHKLSGSWDAEVVKAVGNSVGGYAGDWSRCMEVIGNIYENPEL
jgi:uncharacterized phage protein (TIGR01671 family)